MVNTAPHLGHLIFVSFDTPHPSAKTPTIINTNTKLINLFIQFTSFHNTVSLLNAKPLRLENTFKRITKFLPPVKKKFFCFISSFP